MSTYSWHEDFFKRKVYPQICKDAGECAGFFAWLQIGDRQLYDEILRVEGEIDRLWLAKSDQESFRKVCKDWYDAVMQGLAKWREAMNPTSVGEGAAKKDEGRQGPAQKKLL